MQLKWRLSHVRGYLELGMIAEAEAEFGSIPAAEMEGTDVLGTRALLLQEQKKWPELQDAAEKLVEREPESAGWWIMWAYATRRVQNLLAADAILRQAERLHPKEGTIQFNLACYACQLGNLIVAKSRLERAIKLDPRFQEAAMTDPDLAPLRDSTFI